MAIKQWLLLIAPLAIMIIVFTSLSTSYKNPYDILLNAETQTSSLDEYTINTDLLMDIGLLGSSMQYYSNSTIAFSNGDYYMKIVTTIPFSGIDAISEKIVSRTGNYSCTNTLSRPVCVAENITSTPLVNDYVNQDYSSLTYIGTKKINDRYCDAVMAALNLETINDLIGDTVGVDVLSNITNAFTYNCIDPESGLSLESISSISGESSYSGLLVDISINITKSITSASFNPVPASLFIPQYEIISLSEYEQMVNDSLSQSL
ncbi:MAG: hypothetical protein WC307_01835 [Candidatus Nanoarchaeia archaeon]|jgi:hypothetical protein